MSGHPCPVPDCTHPTTPGHLVCYRHLSPKVRTALAYGTAYRQARAALHLEDQPPCHWCGNPATQADHNPPLAHSDEVHYHLVPACAPCNYSHRAARQAELAKQRTRARQAWQATLDLNRYNCG